MSKPESEQVPVLVKLYEMATAPEMREARTWLLAEFDAKDYASFQERYPVGSLAWRRFNDVCSIMELFGVLLKHDLIAEDLLFDLFGGIDVLWETVAGVIPGMRANIEPHLYENFELLQLRYRGWQQRQLS